MKTRTFVDGVDLGIREAKALGFRNRGGHVYTPTGRYTHCQGWEQFVRRRVAALDITRGVAASVEALGRGLSDGKPACDDGCRVLGCVHGRQP